MSTRTILMVCALAVLGLVAVQPAHAGIIYWDEGGGDKSWNTPTNWSDDTLPSSANEYVLDDSLVAMTASYGLDADFTIQTLTLNSALMTDLNANTAGTTARTLTLNGGTGNPLITVGTSAPAAVNIGVAAGVGTLGITLAGSGNIDVASGKTLTIKSAIGESGSRSLTKTGPGTLVLSGANTYTGETKVNAGTLKLAGSLSAVANRVVTVDNTSLTSSTLNNNGQEYNVGNTVTGNKLIIQNGGLVTSISNFYIGRNAGDNNNKVTVTGNTSKLDVGNTLFVGSSGSYNTLEIKNGAVVRNWLWSSGWTYVGQYAGSNYNSVLIDGAGSQWLAGGACTMRFGYLGNHNTMTISNGGYLYNGFQSTLGGTGGANGGDNSVTITDPGSQWKTDSWLAIGRNSPNNALLIKNGGTLTVAGTSSMGNSGGTNNTATVKDAGSVWYANGGMSLGSSTNTVYISSGGLLNTTSVSGGTFNLGDGNLGAGGVFSTVTANTLTPNILNFNKGKFVAKQNNAAMITGTVTLNGPAYIDTAGFADTIAVAMGGIGSLTKQGTGTLDLTQMNTYTGDTIVTAGTLQMENAYLADAADVRFTGGVMNLNTAGASDTIHELYFGTVAQATGTWGSSLSLATNKNDTYFSGNGMLNVMVPEPATLAFVALGGLGLLARRRRA